MERPIKMDPSVDWNDVLDGFDVDEIFFELPQESSDNQQPQK